MINNHLFKFNIDTGTDVTMILEHVCQQAVGSLSLQATTCKLCGPGHYTLSFVGKFLAKLKKGSHKIEEAVLLSNCFADFY